MPRLSSGRPPTPVRPHSGRSRRRLQAAGGKVRAVRSRLEKARLADGRQTRWVGFVGEGSRRPGGCGAMVPHSQARNTTVSTVPIEALRHKRMVEARSSADVRGTRPTMLSRSRGRSGRLRGGFQLRGGRCDAELFQASRCPSARAVQGAGFRCLASHLPMFMPWTVTPGRASVCRPRGLRRRGARAVWRSGVASLRARPGSSPRLASGAPLAGAGRFLALGMVMAPSVPTAPLHRVHDSRKRCGAARASQSTRDGTLRGRAPRQP